MSRMQSFGLLAGPAACILLWFLLPDDFISPKAPAVLALGTWMIIWWITEAVPVPVTAFLPMIGFPIMGVMKINAATAPYANPVIFLFMGGFMIALALEKHRLHERIALNLIRITGTSGNGVILGFSIATAFLSMWISNTATAMMMLPIATSVTNLILRNDSPGGKTMTQGEKNFAESLMLSVGYAASLGGMATLIGTPPNVVFAGILSDLQNIKISFAEWFIVGFPVSMLMVAANYIMVTRILFPNRLPRIEGSAELIQKRIKDLGPLRKAEKMVLIIFSLTALLWMIQQPLNKWLQWDFLNDTTIAMLGGTLMFIIPINIKKPEFILTWKDTEKMSWGILFLFGGGLCLAEGLSTSGIIQAIGSWVGAQSHYSIWLVLSLIVVSVSLSEVMSNVALVNVFVPVVFGIASVMQVNPILLGLPVTLGASIALMSPIATPPNAIVFSSGFIRMKDMVKAGFVLNIVSIIIIWIISITVIEWYW
jgi:sodium-dependent dicarboxylate transporter 2/3/5